MTIRSILINPKDNTITTYECPNNSDTRRFADIIGCQWVQFVHLSKHILLIVDEEGLLKSNYHWMFDDGTPYHGTSLILGFDLESEEYLSLPDSLTPGKITPHVIWIGNDAAYERSINRGLFKRPQTTVHTFSGGEPQVVWEWKPDAKPTD